MMPQDVGGVGGLLSSMSPEVGYDSTAQVNRLYINIYICKYKVY